MASKNLFYKRCTNGIGIEKAHASKMNTQEMYDKKWADYRNPLHSEQI